MLYFYFLIPPTPPGDGSYRIKESFPSESNKLILVNLDFMCFKADPGCIFLPNNYIPCA